MSQVILDTENEDPSMSSDHMDIDQSTSRVGAPGPLTPPVGTLTPVSTTPRSIAFSSMSAGRTTNARGHHVASVASLPSPSRRRLDHQYTSRLNLPLHHPMTPPPHNQHQHPTSQTVGMFRNYGGRDSFRTPDSNDRSSLSDGSQISRRGGGTRSMTSQSPYRSNVASVSLDAGDSCDRFIPSRSTSNLTNNTMTLNDDDSVGTHSDAGLLHALLKSELLDEGSPAYKFSSSPKHHQRSSGGIRGQSATGGAVNGPTLGVPQGVHHRNSPVDAFRLSPVERPGSYGLLAAPRMRVRKIGRAPFKVLDAPSLQDDFYLNLVDWSSQNVLAVGLGSCVYLWSACTSRVTKLCDLAPAEDAVTSVAWTQRGTHLAVGTVRGDVQLWDAAACRPVRTMGGHSARVGTLSWVGPTLASGSRDRTIGLRDARSPQNVITRLTGHRQEVCGLKWSHVDDQSSHGASSARLASGGNDNMLLVWDARGSTRPLHRFSEHTAAVKAIAWSPHQHGLLASGGGTADRCIRTWNTLGSTHNSAAVCIDTGSQVCNLAWSRNCNELVSTHGYSLNQIVVWRYPSMSKVATLTGHTYRVLYLSVSPDGSTIVTGAGDETLRFWQVFPGPRSNDKAAGNGLLFPASPGSVLR